MEVGRTSPPRRRTWSRSSRSSTWRYIAGAGLGPTAEGVHELFDGAAGLVGAEVGGVAADGLGPVLHLVVVDAAGHAQGGGEDHRVRVTVDGLAGGPHPVPLQHEVLEAGEGGVELVGVQGGQPGRAGGAESPR